MRAGAGAKRLLPPSSLPSIWLARALPAPSAAALGDSADPAAALQIPQPCSPFLTLRNDVVDEQRKGHFNKPAGSTS